MTSNSRSAKSHFPRHVILLLLCVAGSLLSLNGYAQHFPHFPAPEQPAKSIKSTRLVGLSPDGTRVASLVHPNQLQISEVAGNQAPLLLSAAPCDLFKDENSYFSPDGKWIAHNCYNAYRFIIWNATTGRQISWFPCIHGGGYAAWNRDGTRFAARCELTDVVIWDSISAREIFRFTVHGESIIEGIAFTDSGHLMVSTTDNAVRFFDASAHQLQSQTFDSHVARLVGRADGKQIAGEQSARGGLLFRHKRKILLWETDKPASSLGGVDSEEADVWAISNDGSLLLIDLSGGIRWYPENTRIAAVAVFSTKEKRYIKTLSGDLKSAVFTSDGRIVAITADSEINIWPCCR